MPVRQCQRASRTRTLCWRCARPRDESERTRRSPDHEAAPRRWRRRRSPPAAATAGGRSSLVVVAGRAERPHCRGTGRGTGRSGGMGTNRGRCPFLRPGINGRRRFTGGRGQRGLALTPEKTRDDGTGRLPRIHGRRPAFVPLTRGPGRTGRGRVRCSRGHAATQTRPRFGWRMGRSGARGRFGSPRWVACFGSACPSGHFLT